MKTTTKILIAVLILSGLMPLAACYFAIFDQQKIMEMFHLTASSTPDLEKTIGIVGAALVMAAIIQFLAAAWIWKRKEEGFALSHWIGIMLISMGIYMFIFFRLHAFNDSFYIVDLVKGILILTLTIMAKRTTKSA